MNSKLEPLYRAGLWLICGSFIAVGPGLFSNVYVMPKILCLSMGTMLLWLNLLGEDEPRRPALDSYAMLFLGVYALSTLVSVDRWQSIFGHFRAPYYGLLEILLVYTIYRAAVVGAQEENPIPKMVAGVGVIVATFAIMQRFWPALNHVSLAGGRVLSTVGNPVFLGMCLSLSFLCGIHLVKTEGDSSTISMSWLLATILLAAGIVASGAKGAIIGSFCGLAAYAYLSAQISSKTLYQIGTCLACVGIIFVISTHAPNSVERFELNEIAFKGWLDYPWLGWGPDNFLFAFRAHRGPEYIAALGGNSVLGQASAHNDWLQILCTTGLFGAAAYALLWCGIIGVLRANRSPLAAAIVAGLAFQAMINPTPIEALCVAALVFGREEAVGSWWVKSESNLASLASFCGVCVIWVFIGLLGISDHIFDKGMKSKNLVESREYLSTAALIAPWEGEYSTNLCDRLILEARLKKDKSMVMKAIAEARRGVQWHKNDPRAHQLLGDILSWAFNILGDRKFLYRAHASLAKSILLDSHFAPSLTSRLNVAAFLGDPQAGRMKRELDAINGVLQ